MGTSIVFAVMSVTSACAEKRQAFTPIVFEAAKGFCRAHSAYILSSDPKAIGFRGVSPDYARQAKCLMERLQGTDARMIGFISDPPR
jgi:hypothetical protein